MTKYLITTAINYTNGPPHLGHCFEALLADFRARSQRLFSMDQQDKDEVFFLTGTDEHGQKIAQTAERLGKTPQELCDQYAAQFQDLTKTLGLSNDYFVRTTMPGHRAVVLDLYQKIQRDNPDDIYLGEYKGWYNVREETYVTDIEAERCKYRDPVSNRPLKQVSQPSYFFRLTKYVPVIRKWLEENPEAVAPASKRAQILDRLTSEDNPIHDLSISRTDFDWGIPVPDSPDHCLYVWMDALINYYSGLQLDSQGQLLPNSSEKAARLSFWPPDCQVIGKDIVWFHAVIWPAILTAAGLSLPRQIYVHDFIVAGDGRKMSKSLGNVISLDYLLENYPVSTVRYYLLKEATYDADLKFSETSLVQAHNSELADKLGNLVHRALAITKRYCKGVVPDVAADAEPSLFPVESWLKRLQQAAEEFRCPDYLHLALEPVYRLNQYLVEQTPWTINNKEKYPDDQRSVETQQRIIRTVLEGVYLVGIIWQPIQPIVAEEILGRLPAKTEERLLPWDNLQPGGPVKTGPILFKKIEMKNEDED